MKHLDKMLAKIVENNDNKVPTREDMDKTEHIYWERRFAEQLGEELLAASLGGASIGNIHSMRRGTSPALVDENNVIKNGYLSLGEALSSPEGRMKFISELEQNVIRGYEDVMGVDLGAGNYLPPEERKKMMEAKIENFKQQISLKEAQKQERLKAKDQQKITGSPFFVL
jgi:hypothetical protein